MQRLLHAEVLVEREPRIHLRRDLARYYLENFAAELDKQVVDRGIYLLVDVTALAFTVRNRIVDELCVLGLLGGGEDEGRVGGRILRLVLLDRGEVTAVGNDSLLRDSMVSITCVPSPDQCGTSWTYGASGLELVEGVRHDCGVLSVVVEVSMSV